MKSKRYTKQLYILLTAVAAVVPAIGVAQETQTEKPVVVVEGNEPKYVAPNTLDRIGRIWAPVKINGKGPFRLVLDTSASSSAIVASVADRLEAPTQQANNVKLVGVTGTAVVPFINVSSLEVGDIMLAGGRLPIVADVFGGAEGVLGPKGFDDKRIFIDFRNDLIRIQRSNNKPAEHGFTRVKVVKDRHELLMFDIKVGGVKTKAILSTGGQQTIGNNALRDALLKRANEGKDESIVGVTLDVVTGKSIAVPPVVIGDLLLQNMRITFADPYIFEQWKMNREPAMLIGMDFIGSLDTLIIDYKMEELQMRARR